MAETSAFDDFLAADEAGWRRLVARSLEMRPFEALISETFEGLEIQPLYQRVETSRPRACRQRPGPWKIAQRIDHPDPAAANRQAHIDLEGGADALVLAVAPAPAARGFGTTIRDPGDLETALRTIDLDRIEMRIDAGLRSLDIAELLREAARQTRLTTAALDIDLGHDPIGDFARSGALLSAPKLIGGDAAAMSRSLRSSGFAGHLFLADGRPYHEAGAGEAQELACVLATAIAYLRLLEDNGLGLDEARREIAFLLVADSDVFATISKFRALRQLWARVESACALDREPIRLHAETAFRMTTRTDSRTNILRATTAASSAAIGGGDTITVLPHTLALGLPDPAARRLARNTGLLLLHEARLADVTDPSAGSGAFESLTADLCRRAWALFQQIEARGGMIASLEAGLPQAFVQKAALARRRAIAERRLAITGASAFPDLAEAPAMVLEPAHAVPPTPPTSAAATCGPLDSRRDSEPFDALRALSNDRLARTGARPRIFSVSFGTAASGFASIESVREVFAAGGIETVPYSGMITPVDVAAAFDRSGCKIACVHAPRTVPRERVTAIILALRDAGATGVYLMARPADVAREVADDVVLVAEGLNLVAALQDAAAQAAAEDS
jgi:methylmalonyl-CoA mutase